MTGLKYFGKTTKDPEIYLGSGKWWLKHLKKHGKEFVKNLLVVGPYSDEKQLTNLALWMSEELDVVNSPEWANLTHENGLDGGVTGDHKKFSEAHLGIPLSKEHRNGIRQALRGKAHNKVSCPHCGKIGGQSHMIRWHFDNCHERKKIKSERKSEAALLRWETRDKGMITEKAKTQVTCPHCGKIGGFLPMKRFHFDRCKVKE